MTYTSVDLVAAARVDSPLRSIHVISEAFSGKMEEEDPPPGEPAD